mgnify:CR=1 FL=1
MPEAGLWLDGRFYPPLALSALCREKLADARTADWERHLYDFLLEWLSPEPDMELPTSGATGEAKRIRVSKQAMAHSARMTGDYFRLRPGQSALLCMPASHIAGRMMVVRAWELGLRLICVDPRGLSLAGLDTEIDFAAMVPGQLHRLLFEEPGGVAQLARIRQLLLGGGAVSRVLLTAIPDLACRVFLSYGMTETLSHIAIRRLSPPVEAHFRVLPGVTVDTDGRDCLVIHAPGLSVAGLVTNDVVKLHGEKRFELLGRVDNLINSGGIKHFPEQLEARLEALLPGRDFFIAGLADERLGERLALFIEGTADLDLDRLRTRIDALLEPYQRPREIHFVPRFARTPTAKIQRRATVAAFGE